MGWIIVLIIVTQSINAIEVFWRLEERNVKYDLNGTKYWTFTEEDYTLYHVQLEKRADKLKLGIKGLYLLLFISSCIDLYNLQKNKGW